MDFFEQQSQARRKTGLLIFYFGLALVGIIVVLQVVLALSLGLDWRNLELLAWVSGGVILIVLGGMLVKMSELAKGGRAVAAMLGGEPVSLHSDSPDVQRLINIVEEMSIASGVPVPEIFLLPDPAINAFAAGHGPGDSAIGVTRGAVERLTRDELQGVIAHEFSHILNGDMRLNVRLIGILNGILCIAFLGGLLMRSTVFASAGSSRRSKDGGGAGLVVALFVIGISMYFIGWIGVFFGNLIKAAVSRQREYLADASAVQFTRNPDGIAGALFKIGRFTGKLSSPHASEASHMYFGNGIGDPFFGLFSTHPPITERIAAIDPHFDASRVKKREVPARPSGGPQPPSAPPPLPRPGSFGQPAIPEIGFAAALLASIPDYGKQAAHETHSAIALVFSLLLSDDPEARTRQLESLESPEPIKQEAQQLFGLRGEVAGAARIALIDLSMSALRHMSDEQYKVFRGDVRRLVDADGRVELFEFVLQKILIRHLDMAFSNATGTKVKYRSIVPVLPQIEALLSAVSHSGHADIEERETAFGAGVRELLFKPSSYKMTLRDDVSISDLDQALDAIALGSADVKRTVLRSCAFAAASDDEITDYEYEVLRAIADALDSPMPPLPVSRTQNA